MSRKKIAHATQSQGSSQEANGILALKLKLIKELVMTYLGELLALNSDLQALDADFEGLNAFLRRDEINVQNGIDLYDETRRFEAALISCALRHTSGNQRKAARLLGIKATTLNAKLKLYSGSFKQPLRLPGQNAGVDENAPTLG